MSARILYTEIVSSKRTEVLFIALTLLFAFLTGWRVMAGGVDFLTGILLVFAGVFLFYSWNYRTLRIRLTSETLGLAFGIFTWTIALSQVGNVRRDDDLPAIAKYGGAGIHFMHVRKRYRASFNFLEHPRVVVELKKKTGPVRDISFSTRQPNEIVRLMQGATQVDWK